MAMEKINSGCLAIFPSPFFFSFSSTSHIQLCIFHRLAFLIENQAHTPPSLIMRRTTKSTSKAAHKSRAAAPFDLSTVKTKSQEPAAASAGRKSNRLFGIEEAPTFYPTRDEFKDPLRYIEKISPEGEKYGIIKIVPPNDYNPDFSLKTEVCTLYIAWIC